jgi:hypothetical protein
VTGRRLAAVALSTLALVVSACGGNVTSFSFPTPPPGAATTEPPPPPDLTGVSLPAVAGQATTTIAMTPGPATLSGTVVGPNGPVPAAVVRAERLVGSSFGRIDTAVQPDGTWTIPGVKGGLYRVRAWRAPDLALTTPQVFFVASTDNKSLTLQLTQYAGTHVTAAVAPNPPLLNQPLNLAVQLTTEAVDSQGVVRAQGVPSALIQLSADFNWTVNSSNPTSTDGNGEATWSLVCNGLGGSSMTVLVNNTNSYPLNLPACVNVPETTTSSSSTSTTSTSVASTTSSTRFRR